MEKDMTWNYEEIAKKLAMGRIDLDSRLKQKRAMK